LNVFAPNGRVQEDPVASASGELAIRRFTTYPRLNPAICVGLNDHLDARRLIGNAKIAA
jgi:hypothetical protein